MKRRESLGGRKFLLTVAHKDSNLKTFISLDFSFREKVSMPDKSFLDTDYPVLFTNYIHHLSKEEIFAEKIRALISRKQGRDLYDLWFLLNKGVDIKTELVKGVVNKEVTKKIEEWGIDLLVMGELEPVLSRTDTFHREAELIFRKAKCSVLIVKDAKRVEHIYNTVETE